MGLGVQSRRVLAFATAQLELDPSNQLTHEQLVLFQADPSDSGDSARHFSSDDGGVDAGVVADQVLCQLPQIAVTLAATLDDRVCLQAGLMNVSCHDTSLALGGPGSTLHRCSTPVCEPRPDGKNLVGRYKRRDGLTGALRAGSAAGGVMPLRIEDQRRAGVVT